MIVFVVGGGNYSEYQHLQVYAKSQNPPRIVLYGSTDILSAKQVVLNEDLIDSFYPNFRRQLQNSNPMSSCLLHILVFCVNWYLHVF